MSIPEIVIPPTTGIVFNRGAGDLSEVTNTKPNARQAHNNMHKLVQDVTDAEEGIRQCTLLEVGYPIHTEGDGRWTFTVISPFGKSVEVEMPGIPLDEVRYLGEEDQNIWNYPRLYVDGSSWLWLYAIDVIARTGGEDE